MKKKILTVSLVVILVAALAVGGTLAYMTDRDTVTNTFTVGNVDIALQEEYVANSQLMPGVEINKDVKIANIGANDAWVWYTYAIPTELDGVLEIGFENDTAWTQLYALANTYTDANGIEYTVYVVLYNSLLAAGADTGIGMSSVTLSPYVDVDPAGELHTVIGGVVTDIDWSYTDSPVIYINAYAIQKEGFSTAEAALNAYVGQWGQLQLSWAVPQQ